MTGRSPSLQGDPDAKAFDKAGAPFGGQAVSSGLDGRLSLAAREPLEGDSYVVEQDRRARASFAMLEEEPLSDQVASLISARASGTGSPLGSARKSQSGGGGGGGMCGFTDEECLKLLAAGKRPWDEDAAEYLESL